MSVRINKTGWIILGISALVIDIIQFLIGVFGVALSTVAIGAFIVAVNEAADPFIGIAIAGLLQWRGVNLIKYPSRLFSLLGVLGIDFITGGIASFWVLDIWYIYWTVAKEERAEKAAAAQASFLDQNARQPLNQGDRREPRGDDFNENSGPNHFDGMRRPAI